MLTDKSNIAIQHSCCNTLTSVLQEKIKKVKRALKKKETYEEKRFREVAIMIPDI